MPVTKCAIIYSESDAGVLEHCVIVPEHDDGEIDGVNADRLPGHVLLIVPTEDRGWRQGAPHPHERRKLIERHSGKRWVEHPCAVIDRQGNVVNLIRADASHPHHVAGAEHHWGHKLLNHPEAAIGDRHDGTRFHRRIAVVHIERQHERHNAWHAQHGEWHPIDRLDKLPLPAGHHWTFHAAWEGEVADQTTEA